MQQGALESIAGFEVGREGTVAAEKVVTTVAEDTETLNRLAGLVNRLGLEPDLLLGTEFLPRDKLLGQTVTAAVSDVKGLARLDKAIGQKGHLLCLLPRTADLAAMVQVWGLDACDVVVRREEGWEDAIADSLGKVVSGEIFGLERHLGGNDLEIHLLRFRSYEGRSKALERVVRLARKAGFRSSQRQNIAQATEELLMNALYHAPVDDGGNKVFAEVSTKERLGMRSPKPVSVRYAFREERFAVAVRDRFGNLTKEAVLSYLKRCVGGQVEIDTKTSGAGLGIYFVASRASVVVYNIAPGVATEAVAVFERTRPATGSPKALGMFWYPGLSGGE